jgi:hypothetical protein
MKRYGFGVISTNGMIEGVPAPGTEVAGGGVEHHKQGASDWSDRKGSWHEKQSEHVETCTYAPQIAITGRGRA